MVSMTTARGTFEVALKQINAPEEAPLGRMTIDKTFHGDLEGMSRGQMMSAFTETTMKIAVVEKKHTYELEYAIGE